MSSGGDQSQFQSHSRSQSYEATNDAPPIEAAIHDGDYEGECEFECECESKGTGQSHEAEMNDNAEHLRSILPSRDFADFDSTICGGTLTSKNSLRVGNAVFRIFDSSNETAAAADDYDEKQEQYPNEVGKSPHSETHAHAHARKPIISSNIEVILYLSAFSIIGSSLRVYLGRIFGYDCEFPPSPSEMDYLSPLSTCLTGTGMTDKQSGALFIDLPANMLGSLLMGMVTPASADKDMPVLPWLDPDHRLQNVAAIHLSLRFALCGSITTFSSWNTQMVAMMVGYETASGSPRIVQAIFGYIIGLNCAIVSFHVGRHIGKGIYTFRQRRSDSGVEESRGIRESPSGDDTCTDVESQSTGTGVSKIIVFPFRKISIFSFIKALGRLVDVLIHGKYSPFFFVSCLLAVFIVGDIKMGTRNSFHRDMWVTAIFSPFGTILRWKLSNLNGKYFQESESSSDLLKYFPFGTFFANFLGCIISVLTASFMVRYDASYGVDLFLTGLKVGFGGNLSTVSTFAKEIVLLTEKDHTGPAYFYGIVSLTICCLVGVILYVCMMNF